MTRQQRVEAGMAGLASGSGAHARGRVEDLDYDYDEADGYKGTQYASAAQGGAIPRVPGGPS